MGLFDNLQNVVKKSEELAQSTAKKSGELLEITSLNLKIKEEERAIKAKYAEMGKVLFDKYCDSNTVPDEFSNFIHEIQAKKETISILRQKIDKLKETECKKDDTIDKMI